MEAAIRFKDRGVAAVVAVLAVVASVCAYRAAIDHHELERLREQNLILAGNLKRLDGSFKRIRTYTKSTGRFAAADMKPSEMAQMKDVTFQASNYPTSGLFGPAALAAKAAPALGLAPGNDLEAFSKNLALVDELNEETDVVVRRLSSLATILKFNKELMRGIPSLMPVEGKITSEFGMRLSPFDGKKTLHAGIDIGAEVGTEVQAPADGTVTFVGQFETLGLTVVVNHGTSKVLTRYGHLSRANVAVGDTVKRGQVIAFTGNSGNSTGPHLHFEIRNLKDETVDPLSVLQREKLLMSASR